MLVWMTWKTDHTDRTLKALGLPEKIEGSHTPSFTEAFLVEVFGEDSFSRKPEIDLAHCTGGPHEP